MQSDFLPIYQQKMSSYNDYAKSNIFSEMKGKKIQLNYTPKMQIIVDTESCNRQIVKYEVRWCEFIMGIFVLNIKNTNSKHQGFISKGAFGSIYAGKFNNENFVMKCLPIL